MKNKFDILNDWIRNTESSIVNFLSMFAPWLAPLVPAYMTYQHAISPIMNFPPQVATPAALVVEILGFSAVSTYLSFYFHNRRIERQMSARKKKGHIFVKKTSIRRAPVEVVIIAFFFYLALIIFSNVLLDAFPSERWAVIMVRALFTLQTIPAALIVAVRTQHRDLLSELSKKKVSENLPKETEEIQKVSEKLPKDWRKLRPTLSYEQVVSFAGMDSGKVKNFSKKYEVDERTVTNWRAYAKSEVEQKGYTQ